MIFLQIKIIVGVFKLNNKEVTVIIPMYNGEKYISRCIESVLNQSYKKIELIIVDDNSNDNSYKEIEKYINNFSFVRYLKNDRCLGPANSRNRGLEQTTSDYVLFLDCDDWIDLNCIEKAINKFKSNPNIDIVMWEIKTAYEYSKISSRYKYLYDNIITNTMALSLLSHSFENEYFLSPLLGCKLFKKTLLDANKITFYDTIYEDDAFTFISFFHSNKVALITGSCLYYYQHSSSITHHFTEKYITDFFKTFSKLYNHLGDAPKECFYKYLTKSLQSMINCMDNNVYDTKTLSKYKAPIFTYFYNEIKIEEYFSYSFSIVI